MTQTVQSITACILDFLPTCFFQEVYLNRKSDDVALKDRLLKLSENSQSCLRPARPSAAEQPSFIVQHYAGEVQYSICGLVTKNKVCRLRPFWSLSHKLQLRLQLKLQLIYGDQH